MQFAIPLFLLFAIYGIVNPYLPIILRHQGYSATEIGFLMAIFEASGIIFPVILSPFIERKKLFVSFLVFCGLTMAIFSVPLILKTSFAITMICLIVFAIGFKGSVPVSDTLVNNYLGENRAKYGMIRTFGSIGFISMTLLLQRFLHIDTASDQTIMIWFIAPSFLFALSILLIPKGKVSSLVVEEPVKQKTKTNLKDFVSSFEPIYWAGIIMIFFCYIGLTPSVKFFSMYLEEFLGLPYSGAMWALSAAAEVPFMFFSHKFLKRFKTINILVFCTFVAGIRTILYVVFPNIYGAALGQTLNAITFGLLHPTAVLFATVNSPKDKQVVGMSLYSVAAVGIAAILGNMIGGVLIDSLGYTAMFWIFGSVPFATLFVWFLVRKKICR